MILPDLPYEEKDEFAPLCRRYGVDLISMIGAYVKRMKDAVRG
jgi:tryptophan synthase alpha subunit